MTWIRKSCSRLTLDPAHTHTHVGVHSDITYTHWYNVYARLEIGNENGICCFVWFAAVFSTFCTLCAFCNCCFASICWSSVCQLPSFFLICTSKRLLACFLRVCVCVCFQLWALCFHCLAAWLFKAQLSAETFAKYYWTPCCPALAPLCCCCCSHLAARFTTTILDYIREMGLVVVPVHRPLPRRWMCVLYL